MLKYQKVGSMTGPTIDRVFDTLEEWRRLPSYQLERRADIFFAMFLTDALEKHIKTELERFVIPELPLRKGTLRTNKGSNDLNRSVKLDYVVFSKDYKRVFFVELKTRGCRQKSLLQIITARSWQMAKYDAVLLA